MREAQEAIVPAASTWRLPDLSAKYKYKIRRKQKRERKKAGILELIS